jgi:UDP-glucose 4-epimerase
MPKIIITGGTGYIGSHTVVEFITSGYTVIVIDNLSNSNIEVLDGIQKICGSKPIFYNTDITCYEKLEEIFKEHCDAAGIVHFAAYKSVGESVNKPLKYYHNNLTGLINLLKLCKHHSIDNFVFSSSCTVYGQPEKLPVTEDSPVVKPESPYGNTKKINEEMIQDFCKSNNDFKAILLRYFNPIGAHDSAEIGELPLGMPDNLLPYITQTAIGLREKMSVFGGDYNTLDGTAIRDYINVVDLAQAHVVAIKRLLKNKNSEQCEIFNIGTGKGVSVMEIIKSFEKVCEQNLNYQITDRRAGDIEQIWADTTKANTILGWKSEKSLDETILSAWKWEQKLRKS